MFLVKIVHVKKGYNSSCYRCAVSHINKKACTRVLFSMTASGLERGLEMRVAPPPLTPRYFLLFNGLKLILILTSMLISWNLEQLIQDLRLHKQNIEKNDIFWYFWSSSSKIQCGKIKSTDGNL